MLPWLQRPTLDIDLSRPPDRRYDDVPREAMNLGRLLLDAVLKEVPSVARLLADWGRLRTVSPRACQRPIIFLNPVSPW